MEDDEERLEVQFLEIDKAKRFARRKEATET